ncbi:MAG: Gfo/Idh/MocA family oxidoreductase, partial [candidate division KSB1 bacterium]|nr:Gfo/Idh/MocA family oxidoreductase [candidate division KSB1 bacterium]
LYSPPVEKLKSLVDSGELGDIYYVYSTRANLGQIRRDVNALWNLAPHDVSIILHLIDGQINGETLEVSALGHNYVRKNLIDMAHLWLKFKNSLLAHIHVSWLSPNKTRITQIIGSKSVIVYDDMLPIGKVKIFREGIDNRVNAKDTDAIQLAYRPGNIEMPALENYEPLRAECEHFLECIKNGRQPISGGEMGLRVVKILEAASQSIREGGKVVRCKL